MNLKRKAGNKKTKQVKFSEKQTFLTSWYANVRVWFALFSCCLCFEIRPFALLPTSLGVFRTFSGVFLSNSSEKAVRPIFREAYFWEVILATWTWNMSLDGKSLVIKLYYVKIWPDDSSIVCPTRLINNYVLCSNNKENGKSLEGGFQFYSKKLCWFTTTLQKHHVDFTL